jgi:hypothetical protein
MSLSLFARKTVIRWWLVVAAPAVVFGQTNFTPSGPEYPIAGSLPGDQVYAAAAINANGGYLVWQDNSVNSSGQRIRAKRLDSNFSLFGTNFSVSSVVNSKTGGNQNKPQVALLQNGGAVFVWQGGIVRNQQIHARFLGAKGSFVTADVHVSTHTKYSQSNAQVATLADGSVVIVWSSDGQDGSMQGVFARRFSATGKALGAEFQVNQYTLNNQRTPAVAGLADGNFVVAWVSELQRSLSSIDVYARIFTGAGLPVASEFPVDTAISNNICANPSLASSSQGGFALAWSQKLGGVQLTPSSTFDPTGKYYSVTNGTQFTAVQQSTDSWDVYGGLFDSNGVATVPPMRLNAYTYGDQYGPRISALGTNYMAVWTSLSQPDPQSGVIDPWEGVFGQFITGSGSLLFANDVHVNTTVAGRQIQPAVASDGASRFLVLWSSAVLSVGRFDFDLLAQQYLQSGGQ